MKRQANKKQSKFMYIVSSPVRILKKATEFYMRSMEDCAGRVGYGGVMGGPAAQVSRLPKSFSVNYSQGSDDEDLRQLLRTVSKKNVENEESSDMHQRQQQEVRVRQSNMGANGMGRSCSVGLGKIGRIDEDMPCSFEEDEVNVKADLYPRSRTYAVRRNGVYR